MVIHFFKIRIKPWHMQSRLDGQSDYKKGLKQTSEKSLYYKSPRHFLSWTGEGIHIPQAQAVR